MRVRSPALKGRSPKPDGLPEPATSAPRSRSRIGARARFRARVAVGLLAGVAAVAVAPSAAAAQEPRDSLQIADSIARADSAAAQEAAADTVSADTIFYNLPSIETGLPVGFATGIWEWDRDGIMASGANTLAELFAEVPGLIALWGGDYGTPIAMSAFGQGGGGYRVYRDGFELYPVEGGVPDLQHIGLAGITRVRLDRSLGAMTVEMWSHRHDDGRPFSVIEAGTGDLDTNTFRGMFAEPTTLGGSVAVGLERADTRGVGTDEGGNRTGSWVRYQLHVRDRAGLAVDFRRMGSQTKVPAYAPSLTRTDWTLRGRVEVVDGVVAEAYTGKSSIDASNAGADYGVWGGSRAQHGVRLGLRRSGAWATGAFRLFGDGLPASSLDVAGGLTSTWGGAAGRLRRDAWEGATTASTQGRAWLGPLLGVTVFGAWESGTFGSRDGPVLDGLTVPMPPSLPLPNDDPPAVAVTDRSALRAGASLEVLGATLAGAVLLVDTDAHLPLFTQLDYGAPIEPGVERTGFEGYASVPIPIFAGLRLVGSYQEWDDGGPYLPPRIYRTSLEYHRVHMDSGNLELWWSLGVRGHDPMSVFVPADEMGGTGGLVTVPFYQDWYARIQVRIVTVRLFLGWDNFTLRRSLQSFPDRNLPYLRSFFGLRWDMWS